MIDVIGQLLKDNNMPDTPTARAIYKKMLERDDDDDTQVYRLLPVQPEQRKPLTDEEIQAIWDAAAGVIPGWSRHIAYARAIEAAHGIKEQSWPVQRPWVGLTDDDWAKIEDMSDAFDQGVAWAQARLRERNNG